jgi:hypothetical protein
MDPITKAKLALVGIIFGITIFVAAFMVLVSL